MNRYILQKYTPYTILVVAIITLIPYTTLPLGNTITTWLAEVLVLLFFFFISFYLIKRKEYSVGFYLISVYLIYNLMNVVRGIIVAEVYWDYKAALSNGFALLLPIVAFSGNNPNFTILLFRFYLRYTLPLLLILFPFISIGAVGFFLVPISLLALFLSRIRKPHSYLVLSLCVFVVFYNFAARSNVIKFFIPLLFSMLFYFRKYFTNTVLNVLNKILFIIPFLFFYLATTGFFNIFKISEYVDGDFTTNNVNLETGEVKEEDLTADTRSPLYVEVLMTAKKYNTWLFGRSPARGNETELFASLEEITGRSERIGNEVAILNVFTWTGAVGVFLYFMIFYSASNIAINQSNNFYSKILGLYLGFRWCYAWVEDINYFTLTTYTLWLTIGICLSKRIRCMNNYEIELWINAMFTKTGFTKYKVSKSKTNKIQI
ncbi:hypothetical protein [Ochrovirga pacifica]|uniref:hypothetical protein n=1 Tax=Ochrovirga pacifica TaxID=1042376 RepID=UPI0002559DFD|nr:hypothetical protein [Ochrovirga pacifica]